MDLNDFNFFNDFFSFVFSFLFSFASRNGTGSGDSAAARLGIAAARLRRLPHPGRRPGAHLRQSEPGKASAVRNPESGMAAMIVEFFDLCFFSSHLISMKWVT